MKIIENNYLYYMEIDNVACRYPISNFTETAGMVEFILNKDIEIPMVLNGAGFFWATKQDEDGNPLYEKFLYKVKKLSHSIEYINED